MNNIKINGKKNSKPIKNKYPIKTVQIKKIKNQLQVQQTGKNYTIQNYNNLKHWIPDIINRCKRNKKK